MSALSRRALPDAPSRRGWCPSLSRPMPTGDGLLARVHPPLGMLTSAQLRAVAEAARRFGNGHVDVTARGNLQIRGVSEATAPTLAAMLAQAGLGDVRSDGGPQRLTLTSPLAGPVGLAIARAVEAAGLGIAPLPAKTLVAVEGAGLAGAEADILVRPAANGRAAIALAGDDTALSVPEADAVATVASLLRAFAASGRRRMRDLSREERGAMLSACGSASAAPAETLPSALPAGMLARDGGGFAVAVEAPFGRCDAPALDRLAALAEDSSSGGGVPVRTSPMRGFVLLGEDAQDAARALARLAEAGFVTRPDDPRRAVAACPGAPACASGSTPTLADAARLADAFAPLAATGLRAHVSGCAKGCAHPAAADLTLVGSDGRYGVVLGGTPAALPARHLTFEAALERVRRAASMLSLDDAFRTTP